MIWVLHPVTEIRSRAPPRPALRAHKGGGASELFAEGTSMSRLCATSRYSSRSQNEETTEKSISSKPFTGMQANASRVSGRRGHEERDFSTFEVTYVKET